MSAKDAEENGYVVAEQWVNYAFAEEYGIRFFVNATAGSTVTVYSQRNAEAAAQWIVNTQFGLMPQMDTPQLFAENNDAISFEVVGEGIMITVYAPRGEACIVAFSVEEPAEEEPEVPAGPAATDLVLNTVITTPNFVYGMDSTQMLYLYTFTASQDGVVTFTSDNADAAFSIPEQGFFGLQGGMPFENNQLTVVAGETYTIAVENYARDGEGERETTGVTFTATIA